MTLDRKTLIVLFINNFSKTNIYMAKLLRITTESNDGTFDVDLDDGFTLKPDSKVALQSANFTYSTGELSIDAFNERFQFQFGANPAKEVFIRDLHGFFLNNPNPSITYNPTNYGQFLQNLEASFNDRIYDLDEDTDSSEVGYEARVNINENHKVEIRVERAPFVRWNISSDALQFHKNNLHVNLGNNNSFQRDNNPNVSGFIVDRTEWNKGGAFCRCRVHNFQQPTGAGTNSFIFGLITDEGLSEFRTGAILEDDDFCFALTMNATNAAAPQIDMIVSDKDGDDIKTLNSDATPNTIAGGQPINHDSYSITIEGGRFVLRQFTTITPNGVEVDPVFTGGEDPDEYGKYNPNLKYYVALVIKADDDRSTFIDLVGSVNSPYAEITPNPTLSLRTTSNILQTHENVMALAAVPNIPPAPSTLQIFLERQEGGGTGQSVVNTDVQSFLGYTRTQLNPSPQFAQEKYSFIAQQTSLGFLKTQTFLVQLVSLPVEAYDTFSRKKENTLYTIVENTVLNPSQEVSFNSQYPIFIELKNKNEILLRRLKARIVDHELKKLDVAGTSQLTLLFTD